MKPDELLAILGQRKLKVYLKDGQPCLFGKREEVTPALLACLKVNRRDLVEHLKAEEAKKGEVLF